MSSRSSTTLSEEQRLMYASERTINFRWLSRILARHSTHTLTSSDLVSPTLELELAEIGQFTELAHGSLSPEFIWTNLAALSQPDFPLEGYDALLDSKFVSAFRGTTAEMQGYVAYRPNTKQLVLAFSGTSSLTQALYNLDARMVQYPAQDGCAVHTGFWRLSVGVRDLAWNCMERALREYDIDEVVLTGHSLGGVMCYLFALYILDGREAGDPSRTTPSATLPRLKLALFGSPRVGDCALAKHWREIAARFSVTEYSVKVYNDGVPALPPYHLGYRHFAQAPMYLAEDHLFHIPPGDSESSYFVVKLDDTGENGGERALITKHPRGGHNYYNNRDMEKLLRRMGWLELLKFGEDGWEERYRAQLRQNSK